MIFGEALLTLLDFARENGGDDRPEVARACKAVAKRAEELRFHRAQMLAAKKRRLCVCGQYERGKKLFICRECWKQAPTDLAGTRCRCGSRKTTPTRPQPKRK